MNLTNWNLLSQKEAKITGKLHVLFDFFPPQGRACNKAAQILSNPTSKSRKTVTFDFPELLVNISQPNSIKAHFIVNK